MVNLVIAINCDNATCGDCPHRYLSGDCKLFKREISQMCVDDTIKWMRCDDCLTGGRKVNQLVSRVSELEGFVQQMARG